MKKISLLLIAVSLAFVLTGCAKKPAPVVIAIAKPTIESQRAYYIAELKQNGAQVIHVGEDIRVVLRDDFIFYPDSANLRPEANPVLTWTAKLLETYTKINVKVAGYQDNQQSKPYLQALSTRQAQIIADALWDKGVDTRLLYAVGYNENNRVAWNGSQLGRSLNRRVEISFRYYPKFKRYE